jgi:hypothetical protein
MTVPLGVIGNLVDDINAPEMFDCTDASVPLSSGRPMTAAPRTPGQVASRAARTSPKEQIEMPHGSDLFSSASTAASAS